LLVGSAPVAGDLLGGDFALPAGRNTTSPLTRASLCRGAVIVSTLPDIGKHACALQVLDLEEHVRTELPGVRLVHVASDDASRWNEVDWYHPDLRAEGYTVAGAPAASRRAFTSAFGVGVSGSDRVAHGLFALRDGRFEVVDIPVQQLGSPDVHGFLRALAARRM